MKSNTCVWIAVLATLPVGCSGSASSSGGMQPGKWQMTTEVLDMKVKGMPAGMAMPKPAPVTTTMCVTPEQASAGPAGMMAKSTPDCTMSRNTNANGKISIEMSCKTPAGPVSTKVDGTFSPTETILTSESVTSGDHAATTKSLITSKRIGDCG